MLWLLSSSAHQLLDLRFSDGLSPSPQRDPDQNLSIEITVGDKLLEIQYTQKASKETETNSIYCGLLHFISLG